MQSNNSFSLETLKAYLLQQGVEAYVVGGYVRDLLLDRPTRDLDLAVAADGLEIGKGIADLFEGAYVPLDTENRVARVVLKSEDTQGYIDIASLQGDLEADLARRDFTINAMAARLEDLIPLEHNSHFAARLKRTDITDPHQGLMDLEAGRIKAVSGTIFQEDPIRLLRAVRLAAQYNFTINDDTASMIPSHRQYLREVAQERVREELVQLLSVPQSTPYIYLLDEFGLLTEVFPDVEEMRGVGQPKEHYWDVLLHSLETVANVERLLARDWKLLELAPWLDGVVGQIEREDGSVPRSVLLKIAALLHDVAKPRTKNLEDDGRIHFFGHAVQGAEMAGEALGRLRFSGRQIERVQGMIVHHLRLWQMSHEDLPTKRAIYRYFRSTGEVAFDIMLLSLADFLATVGHRLDLKEWKAHTRMMEYIISEYERDQRVVRPPKLISGHDLMEAFNMQPGPEMGRFLEEIREAQAAGEITTREEALEQVQKLLKGDYLL